MRQVNVQVLSGADTGSVIGSTIDANQLVEASFHFIIGDTGASGSCVIQASNDIAQVGQTAQNFTPTNWATISTTAQAAGTQQVMVQLSEISYRWLRAVYTHSAGGSSTVVCNLFATGV